MIWNYVIIWAVTTLINYVFAPKPQNEEPASVKDVDIPSVDEGTDIPVIFGCMEVSPFVCWYGDFDTDKITQGGKK